MLYAACMWGLDPHETGLGIHGPADAEPHHEQVLLLRRLPQASPARWRAQVVQNGGLILEAAGVDEDPDRERPRRRRPIAHEGRVLRSKVVMSTLDPHTTFFDLVGEEHLPETSPQGRRRGLGMGQVELQHPPHRRPRAAPLRLPTIPGSTSAFATVMGIESVDHLLAPLGRT